MTEHALLLAVVSERIAMQREAWRLVLAACSERGSKRHELLAEAMTVASEPEQVAQRRRTLANRRARRGAF
jgi:hypothetical protein